jgi:hypothetical protein
MELEVVWNIRLVEREVETGYVFNAHWVAYCSFETFYAENHGRVNLQRTDNLIPYEDLNEELLISWVKDEINKEQNDQGSVEEIESFIKNHIELQKNPPTASGLPWE